MCVDVWPVYFRLRLADDFLQQWVAVYIIPCKWVSVGPSSCLFSSSFLALSFSISCLGLSLRWVGQKGGDGVQIVLQRVRRKYYNIYLCLFLSKNTKELCPLVTFTHVELERWCPLSWGIRRKVHPCQEGPVQRAVVASSSCSPLHFDQFT